MWHFNCTEAELQHHGIRGMKWGVRRYQNEDGSLTDAGKRRNAKIDRRIERIELQRLANKKSVERLDKQAKDAYRRSRAQNQVAFEITELSAKYAIARQKAKKDIAYKNTDEYKNARADLGKSYLDRIIMGNEAYFNAKVDEKLKKNASVARGKSAVASAYSGLI